MVGAAAGAFGIGVDEIDDDLRSMDNDSALEDFQSLFDIDAESNIDARRLANWHSSM